MPVHSADEAISSGITGPDAGTARQAGRIRGNSLGISLMLIAEYGLGIGVNLYVRVLTADRGKGLASAAGRALTSQPVLLAMHAELGMLLLAAAAEGEKTFAAAQPTFADGVQRHFAGHTNAAEIRQLLQLSERILQRVPELPRTGRR